MKNNTLLPDFTLLGVVSTILGIVTIFPLLLFLVVLDVGGDNSADTGEGSVESADYGTRVAEARDAIENPGPVDFVVEVRSAASDSGGSAVAVAMIDPTSYDEATVRAGEANYLGVCSACHGTDLHGISGLGKTLIDSEFVRGHTDEGLVAFTIVGRAIWDPENTTGVQMPARGGNPGLTDQDLYNIIAYIRVQDGYSGPVTGAATTETVATANTDGNGSDTVTNTEPVEFTPIDTSGLSATGSSEPVEFTPIDTSGLSATDDNTEAASGIDGAVIYEDLCTSDTAGTLCDFLATVTDEARLRDLLTNGSSPFDSSVPSDVYVPVRGGTLLFTDAQIDAIIAYLSGTEEPASSPTSTTPADSEGATLYEDLCASDTAGTLCDFLTTITDEARLRDLLTNGSSPFDSSVPSDVYVPVRGGMMLLTDAQIDAIINHLLGTEAPSAETSEATETTETSSVATSDAAETRALSTDRSGRDGATVFAALCGEGTTAQSGCDYLQGLVTADFANYDKMIDLLRNGPSPFDNTLPAGLVLPARGGMLVFSDDEISNLVDHLFLEAGYGTRASEELTVISDHAAVLYLNLCTVDASTQIMCDYLVGLINDGAEREQLVEMLTNGTSASDSEVPEGVIVPQRGGDLNFTDEDIQQLVDYLYGLAAGPTDDTSYVPPFHTQERTEANVSYVGRLQGSVVFPHRSLPDFTMPSTSGENFTFSDYRGRTVIVYFGYMTCPDVCPMTMVEIRRAYLSLENPQDKVTVIFITIDPDRDTLDIMERYVEGFNADFIGLRPENEEQLQTLMNAFGVVKEVREVDSSLGYLVDHSATVFMVGPDGRLISQFPFGVPYTEIANDVNVLSDYLVDINDADVIAEYVTNVDPSREYRIVIPEGTGDLLQMGEDPGIIPLEINLTLGVQDILVIENHDNTDYLVGGIWVAPHETVAKQFYEEQTFVGLCTVTVGRDLIEIIVRAPEE